MMCLVSLADSKAKTGIWSKRFAQCMVTSKFGARFGDNTRYLLTNVTLKLCDDAKCENVTDGIPVVCAMAPVKDVHYGAVLPVGVVADFKHCEDGW